MKYIIFGLIAIVIGFLLIRLFTPQAGATFTPKFYVCHAANNETLHLPIGAYLAHLFQHEADYAGVCEEPLPDYCPEEGYQPYGPCEPEEETKVEETPPSPYNDGGASDPNATKAPPAVVCTVPFEVARTWYSDGQLYWASDVQGVQKFSIVYGSSADQMIYGIDNIPAGSGVRSIDKPKSDFKQTWFSVWTWKDGCANQSTPIDP